MTELEAAQEKIEKLVRERDEARNVAREEFTRIQRSCRCHVCAPFTPDPMASVMKCGPDAIDRLAEAIGTVDAQERKNLTDHIAALELQVSELVTALDSVHTPARCPYNSHGRCLACNALKNIRVPDGAGIPKEDTCVLCKKEFNGTFLEKKNSWCDECGVYVCGLCRASHNMNAHPRDRERPVSEPSKCSSHDFVFSGALNARMCELCGFVEKAKSEGGA